MISKILITLSELLKLCFLRTTPATLPYSPWLLGLLLVGVFILNIMGFEEIKQLTQLQIVMVSLTHLVVLMSGIYFLLARRQRQARFSKVLIAYLGTELLLTLFMQALSRIVPDESQLLPWFFLWSLLVKSYILKQALEIKMASAILTMLGLYMVISLPIYLILPSLI